MAKVLATNHTSFTVSDIDRTLAFFRDALGFEVTSKGPRSPSLIQAITGVEGAEVLIAYVRGPGHSIELIEYIEPETRSSVRPQPCDTGFSHIAYDVDDIDAAINYPEVYSLVAEVANGESCQLVEAIAHRIAEKVGHRFAPIDLIVRVRKPNPPLAAHFDGIEVEIRRAYA